MSPYLIGSLLGSFVITGLISRVVDKYLFKSSEGIQKAVFVALTTILVCLGIGAVTMGIRDAAFNYGPTVALWLIIDLIRASRRTNRQPPRNGAA